MGLLSRIRADMLLRRLESGAQRTGKSRKAAQSLYSEQRDTPWEWGAVESKGKLADPFTSRMAASISIPEEAVPAGAVFHHTHPYRAQLNANQAPLSLSIQDLDVGDGGAFKGIRSYEPDGGYGAATFSERYRQMRRKTDSDRVSDAIEKALERASGVSVTSKSRYIPVEPSGAKIDVTELPMQKALGLAMRRHGLLSRYGYSPGTASQRDSIRELAPAILAMEREMYRAMHGPIHNLPYPITWGGISAGVGAGALGGAAYWMGR